MNKTVPNLELLHFSPALMPKLVMGNMAWQEPRNMLKLVMGSLAWQEVMKFLLFSKAALALWGRPPACPTNVLNGMVFQDRRLGGI